MPKNTTGHHFLCLFASGPGTSRNRARSSIPIACVSIADRTPVPSPSPTNCPKSFRLRTAGKKKTPYPPSIPAPHPDAGQNRSVSSQLSATKFEIGFLNYSDAFGTLAGISASSQLLVDCREVTITSCYASKLVWRQAAKSPSPATNVQNSAALLNRVLCLRATSFAPSSP